MLGGASKSIFDILSNLDRSRVEPFFASIYDEFLATKIKNLGIHFFKLPILSRKDPKSIFLSTTRIFQYIRQNQIDIIHNNQCNDTIYSLLPAKITRTPIITHHRDHSFYRLDRFLTSMVTFNVAISSWQNQDYLGNKAVLIHNGIPKSSIPPKIPQRAHEKTRIGLVGRIAPMKGHDIFIKAAGIVHQLEPDVEFFIIGDDSGLYYPEFLQKIKSLIIDLNLSDAVKFRGYINDNSEIYSDLDISVVPSRREPFGKTMIESMAHGLPVIGTSDGGAVDIITKETGLIVPPENEQKLAEAMLYLINHPEICERFGEAGRNRVLNYFTINHTLAKLYLLYEKCLLIK